jgi:hypothetical protein
LYVHRQRLATADKGYRDGKTPGSGMTTVREKNVFVAEMFSHCAEKKREQFRNPVSEPEVDVMLTIFCDFCQFSAKKLAFFSKTNVMIKLMHNLALF